MPRRVREGIMVVASLKFHAVSIRLFVRLKNASKALKPPGLIHCADCIHVFWPERSGGIPAVLSIRAGARVHREARERERRASGRGLEVTDCTVLCLTLPRYEGFDGIPPRIVVDELGTRLTQPDPVLSRNAL